MLSDKNIVKQPKKNLNFQTVKKFDLTDTEKKIYGNRTPEGYVKMKVLGRGG